MGETKHDHPRHSIGSKVQRRPGHASERRAAEAHRRAARNLAQLKADAEALRMDLTSDQIIKEAFLVNHKRVARKTRTGYEPKARHFAEYLESACGRNLYTVRPKDVVMFLNHLEEKGGADPHDSRRDCAWCRERGYPDGKDGHGWDASTRKQYLASIRFIYFHFAWETDLPDLDPTAHVAGPKVANEPQWSPNKEEVEQLLDAPGRPRDRLLAHWIFFAPSRREPFVNARWSHIDLEEGTWDLVGKGRKADMFDLHWRLLRELRTYRDWQIKQAERYPQVAAALADERTAFVLLTRNGKPLHPQQAAKMLKWRAIRAGVALIPATSEYDSLNGMTSKVCPHALRRAWSRLALNHPENPLPIDVVSEVLRHKDISTTRRHYAQTKPERARQALRDFNL